MAAESKGTTDPGSLQNLQDIVVPDPVPWWPLAPGWYVLFAIIAITSGVYAFRIFRRWRKNLYRRTALRELAKLETDRIDTLPVNLALLIKRVAISAYPRSDVASLSGTPWLTFLDRTGSTDAFTKGAGAILGFQQYQKAPDADLPPDEKKNLIAIARLWIQNHRQEPEPGGNQA